MNNKKYEFTGATREVNGVIVQQIIRLSDRALGGWLEKEGNLSHKNTAWVGGEAVVYGRAHVCGEAVVDGRARVYGYAGITCKHISVEMYTSINSRTVTALEIKPELWVFNVGCQREISKEEFISRIFNEDGGVEANPHREFYLKILQLF